MFLYTYIFVMSRTYVRYCVFPVLQYHVSVHTGSRRGAGTDANVFLNIFGEQGDTGERPLKQSKTNRNKFEKGNVSEDKIIPLKKVLHSAKRPLSTMLATSKNVLFPGHNHLLITSTDDPTLIIT